MEEIREIQVLMEYEGYSVEEAKLTYASRQDLPATAFCGPDRTYPAHDAAHVRNAFARLGAFGKKLPHTVALKIYRCLIRRAGKFNVEHDVSKFTWLTGKKSVEETFIKDKTETEKLLSWLSELYHFNVTKEK